MLRIEITANTKEDGEDKFTFKIDHHEEPEDYIREQITNLIRGVYTSLVITITKVGE